MLWSIAITSLSTRLIKCWHSRFGFSAQRGDRPEHSERWIQSRRRFSAFDSVIANVIKRRYKCRMNLRSLAFVWRKSIYFSRRWARETTLTFSFQVSVLDLGPCDITTTSPGATYTENMNFLNRFCSEKTRSMRVPDRRLADKNIAKITRLHC